MEKKKIIGYYVNLVIFTINALLASLFLYYSYNVEPTIKCYALSYSNYPAN